MKRGQSDSIVARKDRRHPTKSMLRYILINLSLFWNYGRKIRLSEKDRCRVKHDKLSINFCKVTKDDNNAQNYARLCKLIGWLCGMARSTGRQNGISPNLLILHNFWRALFRQFAGCRDLSPSHHER